MPGASSHEAGSLSARAQEILRRAEAQRAALRAPAPPVQGGRAGAERVGDLGQLLDTIEAGIGAVRAHLTTLAACLDQAAEELGVPAPPVRPPAPPRA